MGIERVVNPNATYQNAMKKKIKYAPGERVRKFRVEIDELILAIAPFMIEPDEDIHDWANFVFVSDESSIGDFLYLDDQVRSLSEKLGLPLLQSRDLICEVAEILHQKKNVN